MFFCLLASLATVTEAAGVHLMHQAVEKEALQNGEP